MIFKALSLVVVLIAGCASTPDSAPTVTSRNVAGFTYLGANKTVSRTTESQWSTISFHDAEKSDFAIGEMHTKKYAVDTREDRAEFRVKLEGVLSRSGDKMPDEGADALNEAIRLLNAMDSESPSASDVRRLHETIEAYNSNFQSPVPRKIWIGALPYQAIKMIHHSIMNKRAPEANNLTVSDTLDSSIIDPEPSAFWKPGRIVSQVDMYNGFGRLSVPTINKPCSYRGPKKSYGTHGGFKLECDGVKWKIKFAEESKTEPFNSRLVWALGYHVTPIDYVPAGIRVEYDRKIISEYASRKDLKVSVQALPGIKLFSHNLQLVLNPFEDGISGAELSDGARISARMLQSKLIKSIPMKHGKPDWSKVKDIEVNQAFEKQIKYLVLREGSIEGASPEKEKVLGAWSWNALDHADRRELRSFALIMAWVNGFDLRANNNKTLLQSHADGSTELIQMVSDLGSGFGEASNMFHYQNFKLNKLPWDLVRFRASSGDADHDSSEDDDVDASTGAGARASDWMSPYKFEHYSVIESNKAFSRAQLEDAKWMVRKLASFSEDQLADALVAAGFTSAEERLTLEKLLDRRQQLVDVFGLAKEFPDLMDRQINRSLTYNPSRDGEVIRQVGTSKIKAFKSKQRVVKGQIIE